MTVRSMIDIADIVALDSSGITDFFVSYFLIPRSKGAWGMEERERESEAKAIDRANGH